MELPRGLRSYTEAGKGRSLKIPSRSTVGGRTLKWLKVKEREYRVKERGAGAAHILAFCVNGWTADMPE